MSPFLDLIRKILGQSPKPLVSPQLISAENIKPESIMTQAVNQLSEQTAPVKTKYGRNPDIPKYNITPEVHKAIQSAAKEFNVPLDLMYDIASSEGGFRANAKNETPEGQKVGIPIGLYQFTPGTWNNDLKNYASMPNTSLKDWKNPQREDPVANARAAAYLIKFGQLGRWEASKPNWGRFYTEEELKSYYSQTPGH
uniref:Putative transglycosylase n=1 Tax=viral metagenome TaxID=1070528 RepID=A0A6M3K7Z6_9ZZZZ